MHAKDDENYFPSALVGGNTSQVVFRGSGLMLNVSLTSVGGASYILLRYGTNAKGLSVRRIDALTGTTVSMDFAEPVPFGSGLYIEVSDSKANWSLQWSPTHGDY